MTLKIVKLYCKIYLHILTTSFRLIMLWSTIIVKCEKIGNYLSLAHKIFTINKTIRSNYLFWFIYSEQHETCCLVTYEVFLNIHIYEIPTEYYSYISIEFTNICITVANSFTTIFNFIQFCQTIGISDNKMYE